MRGSLDAAPINVKNSTTCTRASLYVPRSSTSSASHRLQRGTRVRDFVKLSSGFWRCPAGRLLKKQGMPAQLMALYLTSSPHANYIGVYHLPIDYIASDTGMSEAAVREALSCVEKAGFASYDPESETVYIYNAAREQIGESLKPNDKRVPFVQKEFDALPLDCPHIERFYTQYADAYHLSRRPSQEGYTAPNVSASMRVPPVKKVSLPAAKAAAPVASAKHADPTKQGVDAADIEYLYKFNAWRASHGCRSPETDREVLAKVRELVASDGADVASEALYIALTSRDANLGNWATHVCAARAGARYGDRGDTASPAYSEEI